VGVSLSERAGVGVFFGVGVVATTTFLFAAAGDLCVGKVSTCSAQTPWPFSSPSSDSSHNDKI
jgi:hypothetical protein